MLREDEQHYSPKVHPHAFEAQWWKKMESFHTIWWSVTLQDVKTFKDDWNNNKSFCFHKKYGKEPIMIKNNNEVIIIFHSYCAILYANI